MTTTIEETKTEAKLVKPALWLSRHEPTKTQVQEIEEKGFILVGEQDGKNLGETSITDEDAQTFFFEQLMEVIKLHKVEAIFGVFPVPVLELMAHSVDDCGGDMSKLIPCWSAWNVMRASQGEKPTFQHLRFCWVGGVTREEEPTE
jgi:hypothetical protein